MTVSSDHTPNVTVNAYLQDLPTPGAGFGIVTLMVDEAQGTGNGLNGDRYMEFASLAEATTAQTAGYITAEVLAACTNAFSQTPAPTAFRVCRVDTVAVESYSDAYALYVAELPGSIYGFCMDSRDGATQEAFAVTIEASEHILYLQSADAEVLTTGFPTAMADMEEYERVGGVYHDVAAEWMDVSGLVRWLTWDPDETSAPGEGTQASVVGYTTMLTATQRNYAIANNFGVLGTWGSTDYWLDNVVAFSGRPFYEQLTADWFSARVSENIQTMHQRETNLGRKILVAPSGMAQVVAEITKVTDLGEQVGHFTPGQVVITPQAITDADRTARRLRVTVEAQVGISTRIFTVNAYFNTTEVVS